MYNVINVFLDVQNQLSIEALTLLLVSKPVPIDENFGNSIDPF